MIIYPNESFVTQQGLQSNNFADEEWKDRVLVIDDTSELGKEILSGREFEVVLEGNKVIDVNLLPEPEPLPPEPTLEEKLNIALAENTAETVNLMFELQQAQAIEQAQSNAEMVELIMSLGGAE